MYVSMYVCMYVCACVCVCVCVCVCPSPNVEPKPIDRSRSNSIYRVLMYISRAVFLVFPLPLKLRAVHIIKEFKISNFSKIALTILIKFCDFIVHSKPNIIWHYRLFPEKSLKLEKWFLIFCPSPNVAPKPTGQSRSHSISRVPLQMSLAHFFRFRSTLKIKGSSHKKKIKNFDFLKNGSNDFD